MIYVAFNDVPAQHSYLDERFGLFIIVVLGETIVAVTSATADTEWQVPAAATAIAGLGPLIFNLAFASASVVPGDVENTLQRISSDVSSPLFQSGMSRTSGKC